MRQTLTALALLGGLFPATGQAIVNIEELRSGADEPGLKTRVSLSASGAQGNTNRITLHSDLRLHWQRKQHDELLIFNRSYGESSKIRDINKSFLHFRHGQHLDERRTIEGFIQAESNEFARMDFRGLVGGGLRLRLDRSERNRYFLGLGVFHEQENIDTLSGLNEAEEKQFWRGNLYFVIKHTFNDVTRINSTTYYQPKFQDGSDLRMLEEILLLVGLSKRLDLRLSLEINHDSQPALTVEQTDTTYSSGIVYKF